MADTVYVDFDFSHISKEFERMKRDLSKVEIRATLKAARVVKESLNQNMGRSNIKDSDYVHMQDDILISALKQDSDDDTVREIYGGKKTGYKWHFLNNGTSNMAGNQFMDRSILETEDQVQDIIEKEIKSELGL